MVDGMPAIFYHYESFQLFHGTRIPGKIGFQAREFRKAPGTLPLSWTVGFWWEIDERERALHWDDYARKVSDAIAAVRGVAPDFSDGIQRINLRAHASEAYGALRERIAQRRHPT
jgi:hypothetical protein